MQIEIINANIDHSPFIAECVMAAIGFYEFGSEMTPTQKSVYEGLHQVCRSEHLLYSYRHTRMAYVDGQLAGCLVSYDGALYKEAHDETFAAFKALDSQMDESLYGDAETAPGEFYLDSMAVLPEFRGNGLGKLLLLDGIAIAKERGFAKAALIADKAHPRVIEYYKSVGFKTGEEFIFFGEPYLRMFIELQK